MYVYALQYSVFHEIWVLTLVNLETTLGGRSECGAIYTIERPSC